MVRARAGLANAGQSKASAERVRLLAEERERQIDSSSRRNSLSALSDGGDVVKRAAKATAVRRAALQMHVTSNLSQALPFDIETGRYVCLGNVYAM
jgi:hypothetical protein